MQTKVYLIQTKLTLDTTILHLIQTKLTIDTNNPGATSAGASAVATLCNAGGDVGPLGHSTFVRPLARARIGPPCASQRAPPRALGGRSSVDFWL